MRHSPGDARGPMVPGSGHSQRGFTNHPEADWATSVPQRSRSCQASPSNPPLSLSRAGKNVLNLRTNPWRVDTVKRAVTARRSGLVIVIVLTPNPAAVATWRIRDTSRPLGSCCVYTQPPPVVPLLSGCVAPCESTFSDVPRGRSLPGNGRQIRTLEHIGLPHQPPLAILLGGGHRARRGGRAHGHEHPIRPANAAELVIRRGSPSKPDAGNGHAPHALQNAPSASAHRRRPTRHRNRSRVAPRHHQRPDRGGAVHRRISARDWAAGRATTGRRHDRDHRHAERDRAAANAHGRVATRS